MSPYLLLTTHTTYCLLLTNHSRWLSPYLLRTTHTTYCLLLTLTTAYYSHYLLLTTHTTHSSLKVAIALPTAYYSHYLLLTTHYCLLLTLLLITQGGYRVAALGRAAHRALRLLATHCDDA